jgi:hypothetical protein
MTMPYIVMTKRPDQAAHEDRFYEDNDDLVITSRRAVATLDETQQEVADLVGRLSHAHYAGGDWTGRKRTVDRLLDAAFYLPEQGGTVGPLPDGTVIEVERVDDSYFDGFRPEMGSLDEAIAAYNASQEG